MDTKTEEATFAAGCFWGVEAVFRQIEGVLSAEVGYTGGTTPHPTYEQVCSHTTGHAEAVRLQFDPEAVSYECLVLIFFENHNPTTPDRQGPDVGSQYRSEIFCHSPQQRQVAERVMRELTESGRYADPIVTRIADAGRFWRAEDYHQQYYAKHGLRPTCHRPR